jgi:archaellum component FlaC
MAAACDPDSVEGVHVIVRQEDKTGGDPTLADIAERMDAGFAKVDERFEQVDERFEKVDERFDAVDERFEKVDERFDAVDERFEKVDDRFESLRLELKGDIKDLDAKFDQKIDKLDTKLNWLVGLIVLVALSAASLAVAITGLVHAGAIGG